jgi:acyl-CoA reductase-like NAD-dependent aldehyde dehydrogenase
VVDQLSARCDLDSGKPATYARAVDIPLAVDWFRYFAGWPTKIEGTTIPVSAVVGDSLAPDSQIGPLVSQRQLDRVLGYLDSGEAERSEDGDRR